MPWESQQCAECGALLERRQPHILRSGKSVVTTTLAYYNIGSGATQRRVCPKCWVRRRESPDIHTVGVTHIG